MQKVVAVTVTYNRVNTLIKTIEALISQKYELYKIIIVDNNSNEENKIKLKELEKNNKIIKVIWKNENLGGAGGFHYGMKYAVEKYNPDWYWIMDDDAYPTVDCLEKLLLKSETLSDIGFIAPTIYGVDRKEYQMYHHKYISKNKVDDITAVSKYDDLKEITKIEANAFVGPLFSRKAIETIGIPDKDLFIYGDDTEYTYRISRVLNGYLIKDSTINHQDPPLEGEVLAPEAWWKEYYTVRNRFLFIDKFSENEEERKAAMKILKKEVQRRMLAAILKPNFRGFRRLRIDVLKKSLHDGLNLKSGKTINPEDYILKVKEQRKKIR